LAGSLPEEFGACSARPGRGKSPAALANAAIDARAMNVRRAIMSSSLLSFGMRRALGSSPQAVFSNP
jgi:hypothetical protein